MYIFHSLNICDLLGEKVPKAGWRITELQANEVNYSKIMQKLILLIFISHGPVLFTTAYNQLIILHIYT